ncbi:unnamed protein product, partial [Agarophyton chilense]
PPPPLPPAAQTRIPPHEVVLRPPDRRRPRCFADAASSPLPPPVLRDHPAHSSDSDSDNGTIQSARVSSVHVLDLDHHQLARCTRLNTKLNSLPSGGAFSFLNSSDDVLTDSAPSASPLPSPSSTSSSSSSSLSSSSSSGSSDHYLESRKLIRVDGSAKLSTASGVLDSSDDEHPSDEFNIDGAEPVEEEQAVQLASFGSALPHIPLHPQQQQQQQQQLHSSLAPIPSSSNTTPDRQRPNPSNSKARTMPLSRPCNADALQQHILNGCHPVDSAPSKRPSRLRLTFFRSPSARRAAGTRRGEHSPAVHDEDVIEQRMGSFSSISCFSTRRSSARLRSMRADRVDARPSAAPSRGAAAAATTTNMGAQAQMVAVPEFEARRMVKNISLQRDDFIDFTTNGRNTAVKRAPWLTRLVSGGQDGSVSGSDGGDRHSTASSTTKGVKRLLRVFGRK